MENRLKENTDGFTLIASENHPHPEDIATFRDAQEATFEGGYFEGYPSKPGNKPGSGRYYQGVINADELETLAQDRIKAVLAPNMDPKDIGVNVQAPSGAIANVATYFGVLEPGDKIVSPSLSQGYGHLSHGADSPNIVSKLFNVRGYGINLETGYINYEEMERVAIEHQPQLLISGFSSYPREVEWKRIAEIADKVGAVSLADISHPGGLIGAGLMDNPLLNGIDIVTSTTHKTWGGVKGAVIVYNKKSLSEKLKEKPGKLEKNGIFRGIDFSIFPGFLGGPNMSTISALASLFRRAKTPEFIEVQKQTMENASVLASELMNLGWPVSTNGTDNHIVLITDVTAIKGVDIKIIKDGWEAALLLESIGIITNKNSVPGVEGSPIRPKGLRIGTPAITSRGLKTQEVKRIAQIMDKALKNAGNKVELENIKQEVSKMAHEYPVPKYF